MIRKQFRRLKTGAKRVFVGLIILCLVSTGTGIGSVFVHADEYEEHIHNLSTTDNGDGTHTISCAESGCRDYPVTESHEYNSEGVCLVCGSTDPDFTDNTTEADPQNTAPTSGDESGDGEDGAASENGTGDGQENSDSETGADDGQGNTGSDTGDDELNNANADTDDDLSGSGDGTEGEGDGTASDADDTEQGNSDTDADNENLNNSGTDTGDDQQNNSDTDTADDTQDGTTTDPDSTVSDDTAGDTDTVTNTSDEVTDTSSQKSDDSKSKKSDEVKTPSKRDNTSPQVRNVTFDDDDIEFTPVSGVVVNEFGYIDYAASTLDVTSVNPYSITYSGTGLVENVDYTVDFTNAVIPAVPDVYSEYSIKYSGTGTLSGIIQKGIAILPPNVTYNGSVTKESGYGGSVTLAAQGYTLCLTEDGTYTASLVYTARGITSPTVYFKNDQTGKKVKTVLSNIEINDHAFDEFFDSPIEASTDLVYNAENQLIVKNMKDPGVYATGVDSVKRNTDINSFYFKDAGSDLSVIYELEYAVGSDTVNLSKTFTSSISPRQLTDPDVAVTINQNALVGDKINYFKVSSFNDIISITYKKPSGDLYTLVEGTDYEIIPPAVSDPVVASAEDSYKVRINGKGNFTGQIEKDVIIPTVDVTFNGAAEKKALYIKEVTIKPADTSCLIALDPKDAYEEAVKYDKTGINQEIPLYIKNKDTGRIIMQRVSGISINYPELLFDGKPTMDNYYEGCVNLSAYDFKVTKVVEKDGKSTKVNKEYYIRNKIGTGQNFTIYFMDSTGADNVTEVPVEVKGLDIYEGIDIEVLYNGEGYKKWFNKTVKITAPGYLISKHGKNNFSKTYKVSKEGKNSVSLDFKNSYTVKNYTLEINIDKHAPTGKITVGDYTSKKYKEKDATGFVTVNSYPIKITYDDELSGKDYIKYYISEKFYSSISEAQEDTKNSATSWKTYSSKNKPTLNVDKKNYIYAVLYDKAGNTTAISTDALICDTILPVVVSATIAKDQSGNVIAAIGGQDKLGGIEYFKLLWREKDPNNVAAQYTTPSKTEVEEKGANVEIKESKDGVYAGLYTINGLDITKEYDYFAVAVDNAGNISEVFKADLDKKLSEEIKKAVKEKEGKTSSGLKPAANGIAGGGDASGGGAGGAGGAAGGAGGAGGSAGGSGKTGSGGKTSGSSDSALDTIAEREINRDPYISNATGSTKIGALETSGWKNIIAEIKKADHGSLIEIDMSGLSVLPAELFQNLKARSDLLLKIRMADDVIWEIRGSDIYTDSFKDIDLGVIIGSNNIPAKLLNDIVDVYPHIEFSTKANGELGFTATLFIPANASNSGMNATLYYYNAEDKELIVNSAVKVGDDGYARFKMTHCSDYSVVISPESLIDNGSKKTPEEEQLIAASLEEEKEEAFETRKVKLTDVLSVPGFGRIWLFVIAFISAALCIAILMIPGFKDENMDDI